MSDNDSRFAAFTRYGKKRLGWLFNTSTFTGNMLLAGIAVYFFRQLGYGDAVDFVFFVTLLSIGLWITEAIPPFAVGIFIIGMMLLGFGTEFILDETSDVEVYVDTWTSNVIWLLLGGFFLAEGMRVAHLDKSLFAFTLRRFGTHPRKLLFGLMLTTAIGSMVMSNTATTAMMIGSVLPLITQLGPAHRFSRALLIGIPAAATLGGIGTIIGSTPNAIAAGALNEVGIRVSFLDWMLFGIPAAAVLLYVYYRILVRQIPAELGDEEIDWKALTVVNRARIRNRRAVQFTLVITILLWMTEKLHGIPAAATSAVPIVLLTMTQVISAKEVRNLPWETLMLVAGGLALGIAIVDVGLARIAMDFLMSFSIWEIWMLLIFAYLAALVSNVMSNTAASAILVPLGVSLAGIYGVAAPVVIAICCSSALMFPVSTPSNAISFATGLIDQKEFRKGGLILALVAPPLAIGISMLWAYLV
jgi:solute carrier family 13 (sodium-dependent dicarboxylate transporter), member 2/3/5